MLLVPTMSFKCRHCQGLLVLVLNTQSLDRRMARVRLKAALAPAAPVKKSLGGRGTLWAPCSGGTTPAPSSWLPWWSSRTQSSRRLSTSLTRWRKQRAVNFFFYIVLLECPFVCFVPQQKSGFTATSKCCLGGAAMFVLVSFGKVFVILFKVV